MGRDIHQHLKMKKQIISSFLVLLCTLGAPAQVRGRVDFKSLSMSDGLPHSDVNAIVQDHEGYLWFATYGGLCRYDGYRIKTYRTDNSGLSRDRVLSLHISADSLLYIGTESGGVNIYDPSSDSIRAIENIQSLSTDDVVNSIFEDGEGRIWVCHNNSLSEIVEGYRLQPRWSINDGSSAVRCGLALNADTLLLSCDSGLRLYLKSSSECKNLKADIGGANVLLEDPSSSRIIIGSSKGVWEMDINSLQLQQLIPDIAVRSLCLDSNMQLWVGTYEEGLLQVGSPGPSASAQVRNFRPNPLQAGCIASSEISALCQSCDGLLWIGTIGSGLNKLDLQGNRIECYTVAEGLSQNRVITFLEDSRGKLWISSHDGGIDLFDPADGSFRNMRINSQKSSRFGVVSALWKSSRSEIWIGTWDKGIWLVDKIEGDNIIAHKLPGKALENSSIYTMCEDRDSHIWISTNRGLLEYLPGSGDIREYRHDKLNYSSLCSDFVTDILVDPHTRLKTIWVGSRNGLNKLVFDENGQLNIHRVSMDSAGSESKFISAIYCDSASRLWISTLGDGLYEMQSGRFDDSAPSFRRFNCSNCALPSNELESIEEDDNGNLWIGGYGICRLNPATGEVKSYTEKDNLQSNSFKIWASARLHNGELVFGGTRGFNIFHPDSIRTDKLAPKTVISFFSANGQPLTLEQGHKNVLKHDQNSIRIEFAALNLRNPEYNSYRYRLSSFDKDWRRCSGKVPFCEYNRLKRGNYCFEVYGSNSDGVENPQPAVLQFSVKPHFLMSNLALCLYALIIIGIIFAIWRFTLRQIRIKNERRIQEDKLRFFTDMAHEIKTPLSLIAAPVEEMLESPAIGASTRKRLQTVNKGIISLRSVVEQILDLRKYEDNMMKISVSQVDLGRFLNEAAELFQPLAKARGISFRSSIPQQSLPVYIDKNKMERVVVNLLSNAFKFTPEGGSVVLSCTSDSRSVSFCVEDNGVGMSEQDAAHIFERFYQGSNQNGSSQSGTGIGLALSKYIVNHHKGEIKVESREGFGSKFTVRLLKGSSHFKKEQINTLYRNSDDLSNYDPLPQQLEQTDDASKEALILVVDDNADLRGYLSELLGSRYNVITAENGMRAYERAIAEQPDLILSDIVMPEMSGTELCRRIKNNETTSHIPILLITARDLMSTEIESWDTGADGFITKPFHTAVLLSRIKNLLSGKERLRKIFKSSVEVKPSEIKVLSSDERFLRKCLAALEANMDNPDFGVDELCTEVGMSRAQLYRKISSSTGKSPIRFIRSIRLSRAAQILEKDPSSVSEAMYRAGFNNLSYFSKLFKEEFGCMPKEYGKQKSEEKQN